MGFRGRAFLGPQRAFPLHLDENYKTTGCSIYQQVRENDTFVIKWSNRANWSIAFVTKNKKINCTWRCRYFRANRFICTDSFSPAVVYTSPLLSYALKNWPFPFTHSSLIKPLLPSFLPSFTRSSPPLSLSLEKLERKEEKTQSSKLPWNKYYFNTNITHGFSIFKKALFHRGRWWLSLSCRYGCWVFREPSPILLQVSLLCEKM